MGRCLASENSGGDLHAGVSEMNIGGIRISKKLAGERMKHISTFAILFMLFPAIALAEPTLIIDGDGNYYYSGGSGTAVLIENVIRLPGAPDGPDNPDPQPPDPQPPSTFRDEVEAAASDIEDPVGATICPPGTPHSLTVSATERFPPTLGALTGR